MQAEGLPEVQRASMHAPRVTQQKPAQRSGSSVA